MKMLVLPYLILIVSGCTTTGDQIGHKMFPRTYEQKVLTQEITKNDSVAVLCLVYSQNSFAEVAKFTTAIDPINGLDGIAQDLTPCRQHINGAVINAKKALNDPTIFNLPQTKLDLTNDDYFKTPAFSIMFHCMKTRTDKCVEFIRAARNKEKNGDAKIAQLRQQVLAESIAWMETNKQMLNDITPEKMLLNLDYFSDEYNAYSNRIAVAEQNTSTQTQMADIEKTTGKKFCSRPLLSSTNNAASQSPFEQNCLYFLVGFKVLQVVDKGILIKSKFNDPRYFPEWLVYAKIPDSIPDIVDDAILPPLLVTSAGRYQYRAFTGQRTVRALTILKAVPNLSTDLLSFALSPPN